MCNPTHDEHSLRDALEQLRALIVELQSDAQLEIEVTHDSTAWLEVAFTGKTGEGVKMSARKGRRAADAVEGVFGGWKRSADSRDGRFLRWAAAEMDGSGDYAFRFIEKFNEGLMTAGTITRQQHHGQMDQLLADTGGRRANSLVQGLIAARNANHILSWLQQRGEEEVTVYRGWRLDQLPTGVVRNARIGGIIRMGLTIPISHYGAILSVLQSRYRPIAFRWIRG